MDKKFDKPLDQWVEEEVEVPTYKPKVDEKNNRVEFEKTTEKIKQRTYYSEGKTSVVVCGEHKYICVDKGKYHFKCVKCLWNRIAPPTTFKYDPDTGILSYRHSGVRV